MEQKKGERKYKLESYDARERKKKELYRGVPVDGLLKRVEGV